ncbi:MAG: FHA domain-containing protein [Deltaproteobacteria bacterium]|nr:FHA domain-containing protein [Deltaproteobacteria bacterium]
MTNFWPINDTIDRRELFFKAIAGLLGGAVGWIPVEIATHGRSITEPESSMTIVAGIVSVALVAGMVGGMILAAEDNSLQVTPASKRRFWLGFSVCLILALPETYCSDLIFSKILNAGGWGVGRQGSLFYLVAGRLIGWTFMGLMLGVGVGLASLSVPNMLKGALGGLIGGLVGGAGFDLIGSLSQSGLASRLIGFCVIGLAIGFFIGLVHQLTKSAWLAVEAGRLKGRQFRLAGATVMLGRAEESAVGLFGDPGVQPRHAVISHQGDSYTLKNLAVQAGTLVNGNRIEAVQLQDGDRLQIGNYELSFHLRADKRTAESQSFGAPVGRAYAGDHSVGAGIAGTNSALADSVAPVASPNSYLLNAGGQQFPLRSAATRIGRALDNDIVVADASVSRHHASIECRNGGYILRDLGSQNGTWLGDRRVTEAPLGGGDTLRLGDALFTFHA